MWQVEVPEQDYTVPREAGINEQQPSSDIEALAGSPSTEPKGKAKGKKEGPGHGKIVEVLSQFAEVPIALHCSLMICPHQVAQFSSLETMSEQNAGGGAGSRPCEGQHIQGAIV